ncbi:MAG TPA: hypothetical protein VEG08_05330 [Terriglobales bacterium]|nr:hypothetical protein [Terriglobales bacterium]
MILLIANNKSANECAAAMQRATGERVRVAADFRRATAALRAGDFSAVVVDQSFWDLDPAGGELLLQRAGTAIPVIVNLAISGRERVVRSVRAALYRREREQRLAMKAAATMLRNELNSSVTGILLSSQLALATPSLPPALEVKLRSLAEAAEQMRSRLQR